jgi:transformation/transcription domain-associated protein
VLTRAKALFFPLRTQRDDLLQMRKQQQAAAAVAAARMQAANASAGVNGVSVNAADSHSGPHALLTTTNPSPTRATAEGEAAMHQQPPPTSGDGQAMARQAWDYVEEIVQILKTAFPLLVLSLETIVDQLLKRFKPPQEEDVYRNICLLMTDGLQVCLQWLRFLQRS